MNSKVEDGDNWIHMVISVSCLDSEGQNKVSGKEYRVVSILYFFGLVHFILFEDGREFSMFINQGGKANKKWKLKL